MRIKRVEIIGFKSFCDRAVVQIGDSVTGVVGPNGCGKSNIVDAVRWCMGEQSAKHLRGKAMEDVIFAGSETRGPAPMAEVSLTFDDVGFSAETLELAKHSEEAQTEAALDAIAPDEASAEPEPEAPGASPDAASEAAPERRLWVDAEGNPIPTPAEEVAKVLADHPAAIDFSHYTEVTITRRLYRDGISQYFINKTPCRLRDVTDFFLGTGVGTKAYSIIEQGRIGQIVSARPQDRRAIIEEAAGITKFKAKKKAAEKKLDQTRQNLMRVSDIVGELDKRMGTLRRQAQKAERYRKYKAEMKDIELWKASHRWLELTGEGTQISIRLDDARTELDDVRAVFAAKDAHVVAERGELALEERRLTGVQELVYELENQIKLGDSKIGFERREADELDQRSAGARTEIDEVTAQRERGKLELAARQDELTALVADVEREAAEVASREAASTEARQQLATAAQQLDEARAELGSRRTEIATADTQLDALARRRDEASRRLERVMAETSGLTDRVRELEREGRKVDGALASLRQTRLDLGNQTEGFQARRELLADEVARGEAEVETLRTEAHRRTSRLTSLKEIQDRYEGFQRGTRAVMQREDAEGIHGVVADVVRAPETLEVAVEAALGDRLGGVLVREAAVGLAAIGFLKEAGGGRSAFVPVRSAHAEAFAGQPGVAVEHAAPVRVDADVAASPRFEGEGSAHVATSRFEGEGNADVRADTPRFEGGSAHVGADTPRFEGEGNADVRADTPPFEAGSTHVGADLPRVEGEGNAHVGADTPRFEGEGNADVGADLPRVEGEGSVHVGADLPRVEGEGDASGSGRFEGEGNASWQSPAWHRGQAFGTSATFGDSAAFGTSGTFGDNPPSDASGTFGESRIGSAPTDAPVDSALQSVARLDTRARGHAIEFEDRSELVAASIAVGGEGVLGRMSDLVVFADGYEQVGKRLLGGTVVVEDLDLAMRLHDAGVSDRLVTLDGDIVDEDGVVAGGSRDAQGAGVLAQKREIRDLEEIVGTLEHDLSEAMARLVTAKTELKQVGKALDGLRSQAHEGDVAIMGHEKDETRVRGELERHRERLGQLGTEQLELDHRLRAIALDDIAARERKAHAEQRIAALERAQLDYLADVTLHRDRLDALNQALTEARIRAAQLGEKRAAAEASALRLAKTDGELAGRADRLANEIDDAVRRAAELRAGCDRLAEELAVVRARREEQVFELERGREAYQQRLSALTEVELAARELRTRADKLAGEVGQLELRATQVAMTRKVVEDGVAERYQIDVVGIIHDFHLRAMIGETEESRLGELRELIDRMGTDINLTAIEEFAEVSQRFEFLSAQKIDLERAVDQLQRAIDKINRTSRRLFKDTFAAVNATFKEVFPRLFRGGQACLSLSAPTTRGAGDGQLEAGGEAGGELGAETTGGTNGTANGKRDLDMLDAGVEIFAQPPGKKNATVEQLSGGEKALTAVALVFSIFLIKPSPFCILDEVDAPLDEANVDRYNELVREMTDRSQFIVITHNKRTMEAADHLYGVTMQEPGVSKLVSVNLSKLGARAATSHTVHVGV